MVTVDAEWKVEVVCWLLVSTWWISEGSTERASGCFSGFVIRVRKLGGPFNITRNLKWWWTIIFSEWCVITSIEFQLFSIFLVFLKKHSPVDHLTVDCFIIQPQAYFDPQRYEGVALFLWDWFLPSNIRDESTSLKKLKNIAHFIWFGDSPWNSLQKVNKKQKKTLQLDVS